MAPNDAHNPRALTCLCIKKLFLRLFSLCTFSPFYDLLSFLSFCIYQNYLFLCVCVCAVRRRLIYKPSPCQTPRKNVCARHPPLTFLSPLYDARRSNRQLPFCCQKLASLLYFFFRLLAVLAANMKDGHTSSQHTQKEKLL